MGQGHREGLWTCPGRGNPGHSIMWALHGSCGVCPSHAPSQEGSRPSPSQEWGSGGPGWWPRGAGLLVCPGQHGPAVETRRPALSVSEGRAARRRSPAGGEVVETHDLRVGFPRADPPCCTLVTTGICDGHSHTLQGGKLRLRETVGRVVPVRMRGCEWQGSAVKGEHRLSRPPCARLRARPVLTQHFTLTPGAIIPIVM